MMKRLQQILGLGAGASLFAMMLLTFCDVVGRKLLNASITGSVELTELCMLGTIFFALPLVSLAAEHVVFDMLDPFLSGRVAHLQRMLSNLFCALTLAGGAWLIHLRAARVFEDGDTTGQLLIPTGPFVQSASVLLALAALMHLVLGWRAWVFPAHTETGEDAAR